MAVADEAVRLSEPAEGLAHGVGQGVVTKEERPLPTHREAAEARLEHRVVVEIPGFDEKSVEVTVEDGLLTIKGEMETRSEDEGTTYHRVERQQGAFTRSFRLPDGVDAESATAEFHNGLLEVRIPKSERAKPRTLSITRR